jgi:dGTPase
MAMDWEKLVSNFRFASREGEGPRASSPDEFRSAFEADCDRIIFSAPFRRLARKTQVHPLAMNDQVHTRLTHSLEVANVGRSLGKRLTRFLESRREFPRAAAHSDLVAIIQAGCLAHDIGNPPFGHAGEFAIREWAKMHAAEMFEGMGEDVDAGIRNDFQIFEGNAQGFRLAARGDNPRPGYLRLTFASLGAMIKYPWDSSDPRAQASGKYNVFSTERELFWEMAEHMGMRRGGGGNAIARHPLSFLTEAADDICYRILDLEDALEIGIVPEDRVRGIYAELAAELGSTAPLAVLRGKAIESLINQMWEVFEKDYAVIMAGEREKDLKADLRAETSKTLADIKELYNQIFAERSKLAAELGALNALGRIVRAITLAVQSLKKGGSFEKANFLSRRCLELAWGEKYVREHEARSYAWWLHQVIDYVSSLTDNAARQLSREIEGT